MAKIRDLKEHLNEKSTTNNFIEDTDTIEDVVKSYVTFDGSPRNGWHPVYCAVCGDGSRTKGPRGGWKFEYEDAYYNCFNCGAHGSFTPENEIVMSKEMKNILLSFNIPKREYSKILFRIRKEDFKPKSKPEIKDDISSLISKGFECPDYLIPLSEALDTKTGILASKELDKKSIHYDEYSFYISSGKSESKNPSQNSNAKILRNRLIIPIYYYDRLILLQGKDLSGKSKNKFINVGNLTTTVYGIDRLKDTHPYVFVTEGFWDAYHLNGVAVITNNISSTQIKILNKIDKPKIIVPDKKGDYNTLARRGIEQGWGISSPPEFRNIKDVTECVKKYGKLYTLDRYMNAVITGEKAKLILRGL